MFTRNAVPAVLAIAGCLATSALALPGDHFDDNQAGTLPENWRDVGAVDPADPNPPLPSAVTTTTTDRYGESTTAVSIVDALAPTSGIFQTIPISSTYIVSADVRVDRFANNSKGPSLDWAMHIAVGQEVGIDFYTAPSVGIFASAQNQEWRLYGAGTAGAFTEIPLKAPVEIGTWYRVRVELEAATGRVRSEIRNLDSGITIVDREDMLLDWTPEDSLYDMACFYDGESETATISNLAVIDNICVLPAPTPAEPDADLNNDGVVDILDLLIVLGAWGIHP